MRRSAILSKVFLCRMPLLFNAQIAPDVAVSLAKSERRYPNKARIPRTREVSRVPASPKTGLAIRHAVVTLDLCGGDAIPVYAGRDRPIARPLETAQFVHGDDGMAGVLLPDPSRLPDAADAVEVLLELASGPLRTALPDCRRAADRSSSDDPRTASRAPPTRLR